VRRPSHHSLRPPWIRALFACAASVCACACGPGDVARPAEPAEAEAAPAADGTGPRPPVVLVVVDALRADRLAGWGGEGHAPTLDGIAREGVALERAIAPAPWSQPSVASLFTGLYPGVHGVTGYETAYAVAVEGEPATRVLPAGFDTLAEALREAGYATAGFVANPFVAASFGFDQGFDHYAGPPPGESWRGDRLARATLEWLDARPDGAPPFLYLHFMDVHGPWDAAPARLEPLLDAVEALAEPRRLSAAERERLGYLGRLPRRAVDPARHARLSDTLEYWRARYDGAVRELDAHLAGLVSALAERGLWDEALVILTADHGEALLDGGLWDHGASLQHAELHVPLAWRWPGTLPAGARLETSAGLVDVLPTLLDLLGLAPLPGVQGRSLAPALHAGGTEDVAPVPLFAEATKSGPPQRAIYRGRYKLVREENGADGVGARERLLDLEAGGPDGGPRELGTARPEVRRALAEALDAWLRANAVRARDADVAASGADGP